MHFLKEFKPGLLLCWLISAVLLGVVTLIPGSPFSFTIFIPIVICSLLPRYRLFIVLVYTIISGLFFNRNFFSLHLYDTPTFDTFSLMINPIMNSDHLGNRDLMSVGALFVYLSVFYLLWFSIKKIFKKFNLQMVISLTLSILLIIYMFLSRRENNNTFSLVLNLSIVMLAHNAFYIFNYMRFYNELPSDQRSFFTLFQPFWFLTFEIPENPHIEAEKNNERLQNSRNIVLLLLKIVAFKILLIFSMSFFAFIKNGEFTLVTSEIVAFKEIYLEIFKSWRSESAILLLATVFFSSFTYLVSAFFVYGQTVVAIARLCGFRLPEYVDQPWRSETFADFFSRVMYYYNIIIVNLFLYPALDLVKKRLSNKKLAMFISLNFALMFGGLFARFLKDINAIFIYGFGQTHYRALFTTLPYLLVLSLAVSLSLYFSEKKIQKKPPVNVFRMLCYIFLYGLISPLNFSRAFGGLSEMSKFYIKIFSFGLF